MKDKITIEKITDLHCSYYLVIINGNEYQCNGYADVLDTISSVCFLKELESITTKPL